jgi:hypothetical protein
MATASSPAASPQLDIVFDGTWVLVPSANAEGNITGVDVYSPSCGHPHGAYFTNQLNPDPWPGPFSFYLLNDHSHTIAIQRASGKQVGMPVKNIDQKANHCLVRNRLMGAGWDLQVSVTCGPDAWESSDTIVPRTTDPAGNPVPCLSGADAPTDKVSGLQTLSFTGVTAVEFCAAPAKIQALFPKPWSGSGTLIFEGEVPYLPTIQHERSAYTAMANMVGMDLALNFPLPPKITPPGRTPRPRIHAATDCGYALIVLPS